MSSPPDRLPRVSVCIPAYNRRGLLRATLQSVLLQTFREFEVVISDNASEEDLLAEVTAAGDSRIRYIRQDQNLGAAGNFHFLEGAACGDYVLFLCSDDLLLPDCLAKAVAALDENPQRGAALYRAAHYSRDGLLHVSAMPERRFALRIDYERDASVRMFRYAAPSLCLYRRRDFLALGGWDKRLQAAFDWEMYARTLVRGGGVIFLDDVLAIMRLHDERVSTTSALRWGFYHDAMLLSAKDEYRWGGAYRAMAFLEQLLWDWRLRRSPARTLTHALRSGATLDLILYLPYEVSRRVVGRLRAPVSETSHEGRDAVAHEQRAVLDDFWRASEALRTGS